MMARQILSSRSPLASIRTNTFLPHSNSYSRRFSSLTSFISCANCFIILTIIAFTSLNAISVSATPEISTGVAIVPTQKQQHEENMKKSTGGVEEATKTNLIETTTLNSDSTSAKKLQPNLQLSKRAAPSMLAGRQRSFNFGLGKRDFNEMGIDEEESLLYDDYNGDYNLNEPNIGVIKRQAPQNHQRFAFGIGKRASKYGVGAGETPMGSQRFSFGLGKKSGKINLIGRIHEMDDEEPKQMSRFRFGLGKRAASGGEGKIFGSNRFQFGLGKRRGGHKMERASELDDYYMKRYSFGIGRK